MNALDLYAIMGERENQQPDQHAGPSLLVPESNPATVDAVQLFMKNLLNLIALTPEEQQHQQQIASSHLLIEKYYEEKISNYDPTGKFQTKSELEVLDDGILAMIGLEFDKKGAVEKMSDLDVQFEADIYKLAEESPRTLAAIIASQATNDAESTTEWILTAHRLAPVIAGKAQQRREQVLSPPMFRSLLGSKVIISDFRGTSLQEKEYMNQLEKELCSGIFKEMDSVQVYNPTFLVPRYGRELTKIPDCRKINLLTQPAHFKTD
ncbi:MAG: hypothetical protein EZS28_022075 [Streblomastix strix]|uniref:Uncharacterized protein n=1 Tax=Streblomastix strix TaxID=222440 RepID=A0A5J4VIZ0_9EUKA|nr:MAG: hypothetical protein EZS28_022075 [Streblomastix strix]